MVFEELDPKDIVETLLNNDPQAFDSQQREAIFYMRMLRITLLIAITQLIITFIFTLLTVASTPNQNLNIAESVIEFSVIMLGLCLAIMIGAWFYGKRGTQNNFNKFILLSLPKCRDCVSAPVLKRDIDKLMHKIEHQTHRLEIYDVPVKVQPDVALGGFLTENLAEIVTFGCVGSVSMFFISISLTKSIPRLHLWVPFLFALTFAFTLSILMANRARLPSPVDDSSGISGKVRIVEVKESESKSHINLLSNEQSIEVPLPFVSICSYVISRKRIEQELLWDKGIPLMVRNFDRVFYVADNVSRSGSRLIEISLKRVYRRGEGNR